MQKRLEELFIPLYYRNFLLQFDLANQFHFYVKFSILQHENNNLFYCQPRYTYTYVVASFYYTLSQTSLNLGESRKICMCIAIQNNVQFLKKQIASRWNNTCTIIHKTAQVNIRNFQIFLVVIAWQMACMQKHNMYEHMAHAHKSPVHMLCYVYM